MQIKVLLIILAYEYMYIFIIIIIHIILKYITLIEQKFDLNVMNALSYKYFNGQHFVCFVVSVFFLYPKRKIKKYQPSDISSTDFIFS